MLGLGGGILLLALIIKLRTVAIEKDASVKALQFLKEYLTENELCGVYNNRPNVCKNYPAKRINFNGEMIDGCGYKVIKKEFKDYLHN